MKKLGFSFLFQLDFSEPVRRHCFAMRCVPADTAFQRVSALRRKVAPDCPLSDGVDCFGLRLTGRVEEPHTAFSLQVDGVVETGLADGEPAPPPWQLGPYRVPTPLTAPGEALLSMSRLLPDSDDPRARSEAVLALLRDRFTYRQGVTDTRCTAEQAAARLQGVCQDETHILLALLRMKRIPCRYAVGFIPGEGQTHAWAEIPLDGRWVGLDPTNHCPADENYIRVSVGRDANDCPVNRGIFFGNALKTAASSVSVWVIS